MQDILNARAARERGIYQKDYLDMLLAAPETHHTRIQGSKLWHCALLEFWLQRQVDGVAADAG
jgi:asparagine synthase (glutamine-hydrolysing)